MIITYAYFIKYVYIKKFNKIYFYTFVNIQNLEKGEKETSWLSRIKNLIKYMSHRNELTKQVSFLVD